ncbi:hypothetical protein N7478_001898 [Penicillium angulare]|uniref:uncharacterized protein n=1 Tax=Penicillium angulare TaxID=116970 RepID=UPI00253F8C7A|nr:uncharacterized protein N7478_001898 [Penicillium angulare]KAJ5288868.1 hypothetical protein N7478_001898 [Penicillium angulare]
MFLRNYTSSVNNWSNSADCASLLHTTVPEPLAKLDSTLIQFKTEIARTPASTIFEVEYYKERYALKVFHDNGDPGFTTRGRDKNRFRNEINAYTSLHASGVCDTGLVPKYYGSIDRLDPSRHRLWLNSFLNDKFHPSAILMEYLANSEALNCVDYSKERLAKAMEALPRVLGALVVHNDI